MKNLLKILIALCITVNAAFAEDGFELEKIVVTATKTEASQGSIGISNTIITGNEIKQTGKYTVLDVLRAQPGITVSQTGPHGGITNIYLRGSKPGHTLVMIDGVEVNDPMATDRSFNFAYLTTDNIERIEVIRGPQSTLYGSDAMGGVINIITKKGKGKPKFEITSEGGEHNTFKESFGLNGATGNSDYSFMVSRVESEGISKAKDTSESDNYQNLTLSSRLGYKILDNAKLNIIFRHANTETDLDDGAYEDDPNYTAWYKDFAGKLEFAQDLKPWWDHKLSFSYLEVTRQYRDERDTVDTTEDIQSWYKGNNQKIEWQHNLSIAEIDKITAGFEYEEERGSSSYRSRTTVTRFDRKTIKNKGYYLQNQFKLTERLFITPGIRIDDHQLFDTETTYRLSSSYLLPTQTRFKANWGTGFKAPSLYQLYSTQDFGGGPIGDPNLAPDKSKSYDFGFEQNLLDDNLSFDITYFHNKFENMVDYDLTLSKYKNIGRAWTNGFEVNVSYKPIKNLKVGLNYTYMKTKDKTTGLKLVRRPENQIGFNINWILADKVNFDLNTIYVGHTWNNSNNTQKVKPYTKVDFSVYYDLNNCLQLFGRIENLFDREYQEIRGYSTLGRSFYSGLKFKF